MSPKRPIQPAAVLLLALSNLAAAAPAPNEAAPEADRLTAQAAQRGTEPGGAVDLLRLSELADWLPDRRIERRLQGAAEDGNRAPLVRAVAWWLVRSRALLDLDLPRARAAAEALGLLTGFAMRPGEAPPSTASLDPAGWRPYPAEMGTGELWLDAALRPAREVSATLATRLVAPGGPAVLRLGYDDRVTVWLNGDEVYAAPDTHGAWLDQAAVPVALRPGDNRLVIEVAQRGGAWRLIARVTDAAGTPLPGVSTHPDPWGAVPEPAAGPPPEAVEHLWTALQAAAETAEADSQAVRDYADYARHTGLPNEDQALPRVAVESAWATDPSPRSLHAWMRILPEAERERVRAAHGPVRPITLADRYADLALRLAEAWGHYYARRHAPALAILDALDADAPGFLPALKLRAVLLEELRLPHTAAALLTDAQAQWPGVPALADARIASLRNAARTLEMLTTLTARVDTGEGGADDHYQLATLVRARGDVARAVALLDHVHRARPELWTYGLEAAELRAQAGDRADAGARLEALLAQIPDEPTVLERLARLRAADGDREAAVSLLRRAEAVSPGDTELERYRQFLEGAAPLAPMGPPLEVLARAPSPADAPALVLYHGARTEVSPAGLATRRMRRVLRVLTTEGARRYGSLEIPFVPGRQRVTVEAAIRARDGAPPASPRRSERDLSEPEYRLYYDLRSEVLTFPRLQPGDLIDVSWTVADVDADEAFPGYYGEIAYLQEAIPRALTVVEVAGPAANRVVAEGVAHGLAVERDGLRFEARDVPGIALEAGTPGASSMRAHVHVSTARNWEEIGRRYQALLDGRDRPDAALAALAKQWVEGVDEPRARVGRLYEQVAARTRYVGLELGLHSFKPEQPAVTLARGFGDCKDKATLLIALARALDIEAHLTLVRTRPQGRIGAEPASFAVFDHAIVYFPALDAFLDPTVDRNDPWTLPPSDQLATALVVGLDDALRTIPAQPAAHNLSEWTLEVDLARDGRARGVARWSTQGYPASVARRALEALGERAETLERALTDRFPGASVTRPALEGLTPARDPVVAEMRVTLPALPRTDGGFDVPLGGGEWALVQSMAHAARRANPLEIDFRSTRRQRLRVRLPRGMTARVGPPVERDSRFGRLKATAKLDGGVLELRVELRVDALTVSPADYPDFRAWLAEVDEALSTPLAVRPGGGT